jgi:hypothetical protein
VFLPQQQTTQSTTENKLPEWVQAAGRANYNAAANMSPAAFAAYEGQRVAGMDPGQLAAINALNQNMGAVNPAYQTAANNVANAVGTGNAYLSDAARGIGLSLNPFGVQQSIAGMQSAAQPNYSNISGPGQAFNPISLSGPGFQPIDVSGLGYSAVNAGPNPTRGAQSVIGRALGSADPAIDAAMLGTIGAAGQANRINDVSSRDVSAQSVPQANIGSYLNPFSDAVINPTLSMLDRQRQQALNQNADAAIRSNAFGGSRQAIQDAITNSEFGVQGAQLAANLGRENYNQALQALQTDQGRNLQAQQANQSAAMQASLANQQMGLNRANLGLSAAEQLGSLGLNALSGRSQAASTLGNLGLQSNAQNLQAQQFNQQAGLTSQSQMLDALRANQSAGLQGRGMDLQAQQANMQGALDLARLDQSAQQANQNAALQGQQNQIAALQNAGQLGLGLGNLNLSGFNAIGDIGQTMGSLGLQGAQMQGALTGQQQQDYLNGINAAFQGSGSLQAQRQNELAAQQQAFADRQAAMLGPLNLRMQALGMTPYNTTQTSNGTTTGFTTQMYQPTSSSPLMGALGGGMAGYRMTGSPYGAAAGAGLGLLSGLRF